MGHLIDLIIVLGRESVDNSTIRGMSFPRVNVFREIPCAFSGGQGRKRAGETRLSSKQRRSTCSYKARVELDRRNMWE
jgi:hypothetical protein